MNQKVIIDFLKYSGDYLLRHIWAIFPVVYFCSKWNTLAVVVLFFLFISILYSGYTKSRKADKNYALNATPKRTENFYYLLVATFLVISFFAVLLGLLKLFDNSNWVETALVLLYALVINASLFFITYIMKNRFNTGFLASCISIFIVIDICAVFPFNFLFFFEKFQMSAQVDQKQKLVTEMYTLLNKRNSETIAKYSAIVNSIDAKNKASKPKLESIIRIKKDLDDMQINGKSVLRAQDRKKIATAVSSTISNIMDTTALDAAPTLGSALHADSALNKAHKIFSDSIMIAKSSITKLKVIGNFYNNMRKSNVITEQDTLLYQKAKKYEKESRSQLKKVLDVYDFVWVKLFGKTVTKDGDDDEQLTILTLTVSLLVDFLPLLICIFYIYFKRVE